MSIRGTNTRKNVAYLEVPTSDTLLTLERLVDDICLPEIIVGVPRGEGGIDAQ